MAEQWLSDDEQRVWRAFLRAHEMLQVQLNRQLQRDTGFSAGDYGVLVHLSEAPDDRLRGYELAAELQWEKSRLSHQLTRMEKRGLVRREECPTDGRGAFVVLTDEGRRRIGAAAPLHVAEVRRRFADVLTPAQLADLGEIATALLGALEADAPDLCTEAEDGTAGEGCGNSDADRGVASG